MTIPIRWRFDAADAPKRLSNTGDELDMLLVARGIGARARFGARLVCEEIVLNAFEHGGANYVALELDPDADPPRMLFEDDGRDFDPTLSAVPPEPRTADDISPRGRGLLLIRLFAAGLSHRREAGFNRLSVTLAE